MQSKRRPLLGGPSIAGRTNQLRRTCATLVRAELGLEAAQSVLGHSEINTTQIYAEKIGIAGTKGCAATRLSFGDMACCSTRN